MKQPADPASVSSFSMTQSSCITLLYPSKPELRTFICTVTLSSCKNNFLFHQTLSPEMLPPSLLSQGPSVLVQRHVTKVHPSELQIHQLLGSMPATLPLPLQPDINCPAEADFRNPRSVNPTTMTDPLSGPQLCPLTWAVTFACVKW